jgi:VWFA-related protein
MTVLLFDLSSMSAEDLSRSATAAGDFIDTAGSGDLVSVVTMDSRLRVAADFTSDAAVLRAVLADLRNGVQNNATLTPQPTGGADPRLTAVKTICQTIGPIPQRKAVMYFSAGIARPTTLDQAALNDATNTCRSGNVLVYPVDTRGLAAVAGAGARTPGGVGLFNGTALPK